MKELTDDELVFLVNLLMPRVIEFRRKDPFSRTFETELLGKLVEMEKEAMQKEKEASP